MPELKGKTVTDFIETTVDTETIRYKDKNREKQRQKMLTELKAKDKSPFSKNKVRNKAWSKQKSKKERRQKRAAKRSHDEVFPWDVPTQLWAKENWVWEWAFVCCCVDLQGSDVDEEDLKELLNDTRLLKKLKKGQISAEDFDKQITTEQKKKEKAAGPSQDGSKDEDGGWSSWCPAWTLKQATGETTAGGSIHLLFVNFIVSCEAHL